MFGLVLKSTYKSLLEVAKIRQERIEQFQAEITDLRDKLASAQREIVTLKRDPSMLIRGVDKQSILSREANFARRSQIGTAPIMTDEEALARENGFGQSYDKNKGS